MTHRGKRNPEKEAEHYVKRHARFDHNKKEVINLLTREDVLIYLTSAYEGLDYFPDIERGEVLNDSRGQGTYDKL